MSGFHPGVHGVLCAALTQHEQALAMMRLAAAADPGADVDAGTETRYAEIITGLKRLMIATEVDAYGTTFDSLERSLRSQGVMGFIARALADYAFDSWNITSRGVEAMLSKARGGGDERAVIREVADRLGFKYESRLHSPSSAADYVTASGERDGIEVKLWTLVPTEQPHCFKHQRVLDDGRCGLCDAAESHAMMPDGGETARCGAIGGRVALMADDVACIGCLALMAQQEQDAHAGDHLVDADERDRDDADDDPVEASDLVIHALMPGGAEMPRCGADVNSLIAPFAVDVTCPACRRRLAAQLAEENGQDDPDDPTESTPTEPPGDAP